MRVPHLHGVAAPALPRDAHRLLIVLGLDVIRANEAVVPQIIEMIIGHHVPAPPRLGASRWIWGLSTGGLNLTQPWAKRPAVRPKVARTVGSPPSLRKLCQF